MTLQYCIWILFFALSKIIKYKNVKNDDFRVLNILLDSAESIVFNFSKHRDIKTNRFLLNS